MLIESPRDERVLAWLVAQAGAETVAAVCMRLAGRRRPYVSNVAKALGLTPPADLALAPRDDALRHIAELKQLLLGAGK